LILKRLRIKSAMTKCESAMTEGEYAMTKAPLLEEGVGGEAIHKGRPYIG